MKRRYFFDPQTRIFGRVRAHCFGDSGRFVSTSIIIAGVVLRVPHIYARVWFDVVGGRRFSPITEPTTSLKRKRTGESEKKRKKKKEQYGRK